MLDGAIFTIKYIIDMGASVMLPIIIAILSIVVGVGPGKAVRAGLMIGVGFVGLNLIVTLMNDQLGPAAQAMSERFGLSLTIIDQGWPGISPAAWASQIAYVAIPLAVAINVVMLLLKLTKVVNVDIWNIWHFTFTGAIAYVVTGNYWIGMLGVAIHAIVAYKLGDIWAPVMEEYFELDGITVPHGDSAFMGPYAVFVDWLIDRIPVLRDVDINADTLQKKIGVFGEPVVIGFALGAIIGLLAGYDVAGFLKLGVNMAAVMVLMPKIVKCIMDGLMPLTESAKKVMNERFGGEQYYIGLDPAILLGDSQVVTAGLIFIPITLLLAIIIPGNRVLPFGDLATIGFFIAIAVGIHKGNLFRTLFSGTLIMSIIIWIANQTVDWVTALGTSTGIFTLAPGAQIAALDQGGWPITYVFTSICSMQNLVSVILITGSYVACLVMSVRFSKRCAAEVAAARKDEDDEL